ncbi:hypothetical protein [Microbulbifer sp. S227A]|uniref:hypothetical protein n=1 Tax=Microbulbifer sp. S227A TaxID=3415131 RepID=UPI003C7D60F8
MMRTRVLPSLFTAALLATGARSEPVDWANVDGWDVAYYPGSKGCQAFALFDEETAFFIGFDGKGDNPALDVTVLNTGWDMIEHGKEYPVRLRFGDQAAWTLNMDGVVLNGYPGLHILIDAETASARQFTREFKRERVMAWQRAEQALGQFPLSGSNNAFAAVRQCHEFHRKARAARSAASRERSPKGDDPFVN